MSDTHAGTLLPSTSFSIRGGGNQTLASGFIPVATMPFREGLFSRQGLIAAHPPRCVERENLVVQDFSVSQMKS